MKLFLYEKRDTDEVSQRKHMVDWTAVPISSVFPLPHGLAEQGMQRMHSHCNDTGLGLLCFGQRNVSRCVM